MCARETQKSIDESVHHLLEEQIYLMGMGDVYTVNKTSIFSHNTEFIFVGLRQLNVHNIKSYEGVDRVWVEEAQVVTKRSWDILIPTIRREGSEIWITFNPELDTDETYKRFVVNPPPDAWICKINWQDNPFFPDVLNNERLHCQKVAPDDYPCIWEGEPRSVVPGAIYAREVSRMVQDGRYTHMPYDPRLPVHTIWDLGWNDQTSIIFVQKLISQVAIIDYEEESFFRYDQWADVLERKGYHYGDHWLPHDGSHEFQAAGGLSAQKQLKSLLGKSPKIMPRLDVELGIRSVRTMMPRVFLDRTERPLPAESGRTGYSGGARLMECLKRYKRAIPQTTDEPGSPVHDQYSHGADALRGLATIVDQIRNEGHKPIRARQQRVLDVAMGY